MVPPLPGLARLAFALATNPVGEPIEDVEAEMPRGAEKGAIPAIREPTFDDGGWLSPEDRGVGVALEGVARFYPLRVLDHHEIVNDALAGRPVAVTWCPLCGSARAFDREVDGTALTFEVSGRLYRNDLVMEDEGTGSLWPQILGEALHGPLTGARLDRLPASVTTWRAWQATHPDTQVLARPAAAPAGTYASRSQAAYEERPGAVFERVREDDRLHPKTWVYGVERGADALAIRLDDLRSIGATVANVDGEPLVLAFARERPVAWWAGDREVAAEDGTVRDADGRALDPLTGRLGEEQLERTDGLACYWLAWTEFAPGSRLWHEDA